MTPTPPKIVTARPAETGAVAVAVAVLVSRGLGLDDDGIRDALTVVVGFVPLAITWLVVTIRGH